MARSKKPSYSYPVLQQKLRIESDIGRLSAKKFDATTTSYDNGEFGVTPPRFFPPEFSGMSGKELGVQAAVVRKKSAEAFLELGLIVNWAYELWYEPYKSTGRKKTKKSREFQDAERNWNDFLGELGYDDFKRYNKTIRQLNAIGKNYDSLKVHLDKLPESQSALYLLVSKAEKNKNFSALMNKCSKEMTAKEIKTLFPKNSSYEPPLRISIPLAEADVVENALLLSLACQLGKGKPMSVIAWTGLVEALKKFRDPKKKISDQALFRLVETFIKSSEYKALIEFYKKVLREKHHQDMADVKAQNRNFLDAMGKVVKTKKRDFSKLKV